MVQLPGGQEVFLHSRASRGVLEFTHPPLQWVHVLLSLGLKWPEREACCLSPSNDEVKNEWSCASMGCRGATLPYVLPLQYTSFYFCFFLRMLG